MAKLGHSFLWALPHDYRNIFMDGFIQWSEFRAIFRKPHGSPRNSSLRVHDVETFSDTTQYLAYLASSAGYEIVRRQTGTKDDERTQRPFTKVYLEVCGGPIFGFLEDGIFNASKKNDTLGILW
jgi:hypothetical protein